MKRGKHFFLSKEKPAKMEHIIRRLLSETVQHFEISRVIPWFWSKRRSIARRVLKKISTKLIFLWRQSNYLKYSSKRLVCNALMEPHFDYGCILRYPLLSKALKTKLQIPQNRCIRFCLGLPLHGHISPSHFRKINAE